MTNKNSITILIFVFCFIVAMPPISAAEIFVGITAKQSTIFISDADSQSDLAEMEGSLYYSPALSIRSENEYFSETSRWGYFLEFNSGYYIVNRQLANSETVNLNTNLSGLYWDLTPTIFYNFGSRKKEEWAFKSGLGVGAGYLSLLGSTVLTEQAGQSTVKFDDAAYGFTVGVFFEAIKDDWFSQIKGYGPVITVDNNNLQLANIIMTLGKRFGI